MIFTSPLFLFLFLPIVWSAWLAIGRASTRADASLALLTAASVVFYGWWHLPNIALLACSVLANFTLSRAIARTMPPARTVLVTIGVSMNLALLGVFKYYAFFTGDRIALVLPLAISFFTFTQIAFLVDVARGQVSEDRLSRYCFFVTFFPHLIAGPIVRLQEIQKQLDGCISRRMSLADFRAGISLILIGLAKKMIVADTLAPGADLLFGTATHGRVTATAAWVGALCFHLQIYFDFSGYTDIAIGLARVFLIRFPQNFDHPYGATSFIDFWRRWHMTLSRFLRDYLYIPLGGSRVAPWRQYSNLMITMILGGLWHGAGWNFVVWGGLHGTALGFNHVFRSKFPAVRIPAVVRLAAVQGFVFVSWIFFRAPDLTTAKNILGSMAGQWDLQDLSLRGMAVPADVLARTLTNDPDLHTGGMALVALMALAFVAAAWRQRQWSADFDTWYTRWVLGGMRAALAAAVLIVFVSRIRAADVIEPFIYFQF